MKTIRLTHDLLMGARTPRGGFNGKQLYALGIEGKPKTGWVRELIGQSVPLQVWNAFVAAGKLGNPARVVVPELFAAPVYTPSERGSFSSVGNCTVETYE